MQLLIHQGNFKLNTGKDWQPDMPADFGDSNPFTRQSFDDNCVITANFVNGATGIEQSDTAVDQEKGEENQQSSF